MNSEDYRAYLVECVKTLGQMIKDNAEDIVGETDGITELKLSAEFDPGLRSLPELTITRSHLPDKGTINRLLNIRSTYFSEDEKRMEKI